ncbi:WXG100 family type VII secretion target [Streptomyces sp. SGAir0957]
MAEEVTVEEWRAYLEDMQTAIHTVQREATTINAKMASIDTKMNDLATHWSSPAYLTFDEMKTWFHKSQHDLADLLDDILHRLRTSYQNYHDAEQANLGNLNDGQGHG